MAAGSDFPVTSGAAQMTFGGLQDAFAVRLDSSGRLIYATFLGDSNSQIGYGIAVHAGQNAYITGSTASTNFPTTAAAPQRSYAGGANDGFVIN